MKREYQYDFLRVIASAMVVVIHVSSPFVVNNIHYPNFDFTIGNFFDSFSRFSVPLFVMLSGAFVLDNVKNRNVKDMSIKTLKNIIIPTILWSVIYTIYSLLKEYFLSSSFNFNFEFFKQYSKKFILGNAFYHLWYMYMIIGLYLVTPLVMKIIETRFINPMHIGILALSASFLLPSLFDKFWPIMFVKYLGYYILGYYIRLNSQTNKRNKDKYLFLFLIFAFFIFLATEISVRNKWNNYQFLYFYENISPFVIFGTITLFTFFSKKVTFNHDVSNISNHTLNIYFLHAGILDIIFIVSNYLKLQINPGIFIPVVSILVYFISYNLSKMITKFLKK